MPYPIHPPRTRRTYNDGVRSQHVLFAITILPIIAFVAYVAARLAFSIPN